MSGESRPLDVHWGEGQGKHLRHSLSQDAVYDPSCSAFLPGILDSKPRLFSAGEEIAAAVLVVAMMVEVIVVIAITLVIVLLLMGAFPEGTESGDALLLGLL